MAVTIVCVLFSLTVAISNAANISFDNGRNKRQDHWSWGLVEYPPQQNVTTVNTVTVEPTTPVDEEAATCLPYTPVMPEFNKPGRRISETKCYEYVWQIKVRDEKNQREKMCAAYNRRKAGLRNFRNLVVGGHRALSGEYPHMDLGILTFFGHIILLCRRGDVVIEGLVVQGKVEGTRPRQFTDQGAIGWRAVDGTWIFKCGGALVSPRFVLTAAHCTRSVRDTTVTDAVPKIVRLGAKNILNVPNNEVHDETIVNIIVHPSYSPPRKYNDIALLQLSRDVEFSSTIQPACLWSSVDTSSIASASVTGWGVVEEASRNTSPNLQTADVNIINTTTCNGLLRRYCNRLWCGLQNTQLCAGNLNGGVDTCQGDSGGPLQSRIPVPAALGSMHYLVGVTSFGFGCARAAAPGVYSRVAAFADWIESVVWN